MLPIVVWWTVDCRLYWTTGWPARLNRMADFRGWLVDAVNALALFRQAFLACARVPSGWPFDIDM